MEKNDGAATQTQICPVARSLARSSNFSLRATWRTSDFDNGPRGEVSGTALNSTSLFPTIMALFDRKAGMQLIALWVRAEKRQGGKKGRGDLVEEEASGEVHLVS